MVRDKEKRPLQNVQFCSSSRKAKILTVRLSSPKTTGIHKELLILNVEF